MRLPNEKNHLIECFLVFLFIILLTLFQVQFYSVVFIAILCLLLLVGFLKEEYRIFFWVTCSFLIGEFIFLYGDRILLEINNPREWKMINSRLFLLAPIIFISFVVIKFKRKLLSYTFNPDWNVSIYFPFIWNGFHKLSIKMFLFFAIIINIISFSPFILTNQFKLTIYSLVITLTFSLINSILEEILWRGIILTRFTVLIGEKLAIIFSSLAFGLSHLSLGYSLGICLLFSLGGFFYGAVTILSKSLVPAIIWHFAFNILMVLSGAIPLLVK